MYSASQSNSTGSIQRHGENSFAGQNPIVPLREGNKSKISTLADDPLFIIGECILSPANPLEHPDETFYHSERLVTVVGGQSLPHSISTLQTFETTDLTPANQIHSDHVLPKEEDINQKSGQMWKCVDRIQDPETGEFFYLFEIDEKYDFLLNENAKDNFKNKREEMHPAVEPDAYYLVSLDPKYSFEDLVKRETQKNNGSVLCLRDIKYIQETKKWGEFLNRLGYESFRMPNGHFCLKLPSRENLLARWESLRQEDPSLSPLSINSSEGIAEDREFIASFFKYDVLLSKGMEFVHDHMIHIIPILKQLLSHKVKSGRTSTYYKTTRKDQRDQIQNALHVILTVQDMIQKGASIPDHIKANLPKMEAALSAVIDVMTATEEPEEDLGQNFLDEMMSNGLWQERLWQKYWSNRYPEETLDFSSLSSIWYKLSAIVTDNKKASLAALEAKIDNMISQLEEKVSKGNLSLKEMFDCQELISNLKSEEKKATSHIAATNIQLIMNFKIIRQSLQ